jgi:hypothetical protein
MCNATTKIVLLRLLRVTIAVIALRIAFPDLEWFRQIMLGVAIILLSKEAN